MAYAIDTVIRGAGPDAHLQLLDVLRALAEAAGWTTLRFDASIAERELILRSTGTTGEVFSSRRERNVGEAGVPAELGPLRFAVTHQDELALRVVRGGAVGQRVVCGHIATVLS